MRLKLYQATSPQAAMALIRAELGDEALILSTRKIAGGVEIAVAREDAQARGAKQAGTRCVLAGAVRDRRHGRCGLRPRRHRRSGRQWR